jgi:fructoselysine-6-P-deglycase FrlB-like protein
MRISAFRHGLQEIVVKDTRFGIWIDGLRMRDRDLAVAKDLKRLGASVMLIGNNVPDDAADLVFPLFEILPAWQFLIDIVPAQLGCGETAEESRPDLHVICISSPTWADGVELLRRADHRVSPLLA